MPNLVSKSDCGIVLTGGGARGSYQAGVLRGVAEILKDFGCIESENPFQYWLGVSAGAINISYCTAGANNLYKATEGLVQLWSNVRPEDVYLTDFASLSAIGVKWIRDLTFGSFLEKKMARSLLDTAPLRDFLSRNISFERIQDNLNKNYIKAVACSAYSYTKNETVTYIQSKEDHSLRRHRRYSINTELQVDHVLASCAIPILFPSIKIGEEYFADGSFRNITPISSAIHMGAKKLLVIGVRGHDEFSEKKYPIEPGVAKIAGAILNSLFFDTTDIDLERLKTTNELVKATQADIQTTRSSYCAIDYLVLRPSRDVSRMAEQKFKKFPKTIKFLIGGLGPIGESAELASYILFVSEFTKDLVELGYNDTIRRREELATWMGCS